MPDLGHLRQDPKDERNFLVINELNQGRYFGEISLLSNLKRTSNVYSVSNCFIGAIDKRRFLKLVHENTELWQSLTNRLNKYNDGHIRRILLMIKNVP